MRLPVCRDRGHPGCCTGCRQQQMRSSRLGQCTERAAAAAGVVAAAAKEVAMATVMATGVEAMA